MHAFIGERVSFYTAQCVCTVSARLFIFLMVRLCCFTGNTDIVMDHNLKLVLGLVWHLILHYQVSMVTAGEEGKSRSRQSPKDMLLKWLREKLAPVRGDTPNGIPEKPPCARCME